MWFVVGLGNPGRKYEQTRHNIGFLVVERLGRRWGIDCSKKQFGALVGEGRVKHDKAVLAKPQSFMNRSGTPARSLLGFYKADTDRLIVVHDEVDVPFQHIKLKKGGGHGGHNGLRDLNKHLDDNRYLRVRVGVSRPPEGWDTADYVLGKWNAEERESIDHVVERATDAVELVMSQGLEAAMNVFHVRDSGLTNPRTPTAPRSEEL